MRLDFISNPFKGSNKLFFIVMMFSFIAGHHSLYAQTIISPLVDSIGYHPKFGQIDASYFDFDSTTVSYPAHILYKGVTVDFYDNEGRDITVLLHHHKITRIQSKDGLGLALVDIPYYYQNGIEKVLNLRAITHKADGSKVYLDTSMVVNLKLNERYKFKEFTFPEIEVGDIIEYAYTLERSYLEELPKFDIQEKVPVDFAQFAIQYPDYIRYKKELVNNNVPLKEHIIERDTSSVPPVFVYKRPPLYTRKVYYATHIPAIVNEAFSGKEDDKAMYLLFQMSEFGRPREAILNSWDFVIADYRVKQRVFKTLESYKTLFPDSLNYLKEKNELTKAKKLYLYLNNFFLQEAKVSPIPAKLEETANSLEKEAGLNQASTSLLYIAWAQELGLKADIVLAPVSSIGRIQKGYPTLDKFNSLLAAVEANGQQYIVDPSYAFADFGVLRTTNLTDDAILVKPESYKWLSTKNPFSIFYFDASMNAELTNKGTLKGSINIQNKGYLALFFKKGIAEAANPQRLIREAFFDGYDQVSINNASFIQETDTSNTLSITCDFEIKDYVRRYADGFDYAPLIIGYKSEHPFKENKRKSPIRFDAPEYIKMKYNIFLPKGYEATPAKYDQQLGTPKARFYESYVLLPSLLNYEYDIALVSQEYDQSSYTRLKDLYDRWVALSNSRWRIKKTP